MEQKFFGEKDKLKVKTEQNVMDIQIISRTDISFSIKFVPKLHISLDVVVTFSDPTLINRFYLVLLFVSKQSSLVKKPTEN